MCNDCCKEFKGWCKSFTRTEAVLAALEAILLITCILFLVFLIMHLTVCPLGKDKDVIFTTTNTPWYTPPPPPPPEHPPHQTIPPEITCTWEPSKKTAAPTRYYENETATQSSVRDISSTKTLPSSTKTLHIQHKPITSALPEMEDIDRLAFDDQSDGEESNNVHRTVVLALVKLRPPEGITFGCTLTAITKQWTVTAASCIDAVEEVDSLDNFVMLEGYGAGRGQSHGVADVQPHPLFLGVNRSYDVAALRSEDALRSVTPVDLPALADYFLVTAGERFTILGFGPFRSVEGGTIARRLRSVSVYTLPRALCGPGGWAPRHLSRGRALWQGACGAGSLCAGVLYARGAACSYCAGTPLLRGATLLGVMADARQCGVACEPALYANVAVLRDWLDLLINPD